MTRATMCIAHAAPWKMMVFASSIFLAKQSGSMPTPLAMDDIGPTDAHNGSGAMWQILVKSPKFDIMNSWKPKPTAVLGNRQLVIAMCSN